MTLWRRSDGWLFGASIFSMILIDQSSIIDQHHQIDQSINIYPSMYLYSLNSINKSQYVEKLQSDHKI